MAVSFVCTKDWFDKNVNTQLGLNVVVESGSTYILCETSADLNVLSQKAHENNTTSPVRLVLLNHIPKKESKQGNDSADCILLKVDKSSSTQDRCPSNQADPPGPANKHVSRNSSAALDRDKDTSDLQAANLLLSIKQEHMFDHSRRNVNSTCQTRVSATGQARHDKIGPQDNEHLMSSSTHSPQEEIRVKLEEPNCQASNVMANQVLKQKLQAFCQSKLNEYSVTELNSKAAQLTKSNSEPNVFQPSMTPQAVSTALNNLASTYKALLFSKLMLPGTYNSAPKESIAHSDVHKALSAELANSSRNFVKASETVKHDGPKTPSSNLQNVVKARSRPDLQRSDTIILSDDEDADVKPLPDKESPDTDCILLENMKRIQPKGQNSVNGRLDIRAPHLQLADQARKSETGTCKEMASMSLKKEPSGDAVVLNEDLEFDLPVPRPVKTENVVDIKSAVDDKIRCVLKHSIMKRREAEGKPVIDIDAEDRAKKEVEQVEMSTAEWQKVQRRRYLNKLFVRKYRQKRKIKLNALQECCHELKKRRVDLLSSLDELKEKTSTLRQVLAMTSENKLNCQAVAAIKTALAAGKMPVDFMKECVTENIGDDPNAKAWLLTAMSDLSIPAVGSGDRPPVLGTLNESIGYTKPLFQRQFSDCSVDFDSASNSSGFTSSQEFSSSLELGSSQETVTSYDGDLLTSGATYERDAAQCADQDREMVDSDSNSDDEILVIDLK